MLEPRIAVCGGASADSESLKVATQVGMALADAGAVVLTGGGSGVMAAATRGARERGGMTVAISPAAAQPVAPGAVEVDLPIYTGFGQGRNLVLVLSAQAVIAIGGEWGTLSEIALAQKHRIPVVGLNTWKVTAPTADLTDSFTTAENAAEAVSEALRLAEANQR